MRTEPALIVGVITALLILLVSFGVPISSDQREAIIGFSNAALAVIGTLVIRQNVSPSR